VALLVLRLLLALVFAVAAIAKLADRGAFREALGEFAVPRLLIGPASVLLPLTEVAVAALLIPATTARVGAGATIALLALFCVAVGVALTRGVRPDCACFGRVRSAPVGRGTLVRNALLAAAAALVAAAPAPPLPALSPAGLAAVVLGLALAPAAWLCRELLRRHGRLLLRLDALEGAPPAGLPPTAPAPRFAIDGWHGGTVSLDALLADGLPLALVFVDAECRPCVEAVPELAAAQRAAAGLLTVAVVSRGATATSEAAWAEHGLQHVGIAPDHDLALGYGIVGTPAAVLVSAQGRVDSRVALGVEGIAELVAGATRDERRPVARRLAVA
jgi:methylamine utilization protein MauE/AhpC/TSA family protein